ncbi:phosphonate C-P lyase system protein PhnH [Paraburkholderia xenovorans LB400]|jgi:alpha-D-ribose 1-methylphosphonate 5-triphosphate synthase subunit PhnH|uniref:Phosphonate metabolism PhnH protein n=1 Tax=Paraburkholderia xenovorans (strain LB400) TaxID=266265 RepID=Q13Q33_PARXL|nr:phosphonate C-P lyase system protein PhnH [Paraburkholderia xenovorans]ABE33806.1 Putative phosphonate metabolism PhnH protein [Paraburkholderia xenovorans LB400]AIP36490.1 phosphonate C-P lyase system protein PhnH [Paraburkholderia xenovorans LB400]
MENSQIALSTLTPGFADPVHDTQAVFRTLLDALSRPGTVGVVENVLPEVRATRAGLAAFAALLALCDYATPVWLAQPDTALGSALRFHTGAPLVGEPAQAAFAYIHDTGTLPPLECFALGAAESPEQSVTLLIRVEALTGGAPVVLSGPGIQHTATIAPVGLPAHFWRERAALAPLFPCGVDCYLVCGARLIGLPRTTQAKVN